MIGRAEPASVDPAVSKPLLIGTPWVKGHCTAEVRSLTNVPAMLEYDLADEATKVGGFGFGCGFTPNPSRTVDVAGLPPTERFCAVGLLGDAGLADRGFGETRGRREHRRNHDQGNRGRRRGAAKCSLPLSAGVSDGSASRSWSSGRGGVRAARREGGDARSCRMRSPRRVNAVCGSMMGKSA